MVFIIIAVIISNQQNADEIQSQTTELRDFEVEVEVFMLAKM